MKEPCCYELGVCMPKDSPDNKKSQSEIKSELACKPYAPSQLLELIHKTSDNQIKNLFIIHFLYLIKNETLISTIIQSIRDKYPNHPIHQLDYEEQCLELAIASLTKGSKKGMYLSYINVLAAKLLDAHTAFSQPVLNQLTLLMIKDDLDLSLSNTLFNFLISARPQEMLIPYCKVIQSIGHLGETRHYQQVIDLCEWALKKLGEDNLEAASIQTALKEARLELELSQNTGFFSQLFGHFKRCYTYGWSGFFNPNTPTYVAFASTMRPIINQPIPMDEDARQIDALIETTLEYTRDLRLDNWTPLNQRSHIANRFHLINLLLETDFYPEIQSFFESIIHEKNTVLSINKESLKVDISANHADKPVDALDAFLMATAAEEESSKNQPIAIIVNSANEYIDYAYNAVDDLWGNATQWSTQFFTQTPVVCTASIEDKKKQTPQVLPKEMRL